MFREVGLRLFDGTIEPPVIPKNAEEIYADFEDFGLAELDYTLWAAMPFCEVRL